MTKLFADFDNDMLDSLDETATATVTVLAKMMEKLEQSDFSKHTAKLYRKFFNELIAAGFSPEQALEILKSSGILGKTNK